MDAKSIFYHYGNVSTFSNYLRLEGLTDIRDKSPVEEYLKERKVVKKQSSELKEQFTQFIAENYKLINPTSHFAVNKEQDLHDKLQGCSLPQLKDLRKYFDSGNITRFARKLLSL